jgi:hypothetical protein
MKKFMTVLSLTAACAFIAGCLTSATAYTKRTAPDGTVTESKVRIVGTGDKASEVAAEGMFADGADDALGAGVKTANATQQSTGIEGTLKGMGDLMGGMAQFMVAAQTLKVPGLVTPEAAIRESIGETDVKPSGATSAGYDAVPGVNWVGVYGRPSCAKCQAYKAAHPDTAIVNIDDAANKTAMWAALENRGFGGSTVALPVQITADGYAQGVK